MFAGANIILHFAFSVTEREANSLPYKRWLTVADRRVPRERWLTVADHRIPANGG